MSIVKKLGLKLPFLVVVFFVLMFSMASFAHASIIYDNTPVFNSATSSQLYLSSSLISTPQYSSTYFSQGGSISFIPPGTLSNINLLQLKTVVQHKINNPIFAIVTSCTGACNIPSLFSFVASSSPVIFSTSTVNFIFPISFNMVSGKKYQIKFDISPSATSSSSDDSYRFTTFFKDGTCVMGVVSTTGYSTSTYGSVCLGGFNNLKKDYTIGGSSGGLAIFASVMVNFKLFSNAVVGCMDSVANNYNPSATVDDGSCDYSDLTTHIVSFTPEDNSTTTSPVTFTMHVYVNPADIGSWYSIGMSLHNIDQNVFLLGAFSPSDIQFLDNFQATTSGDFYYSTTTPIGEGNYRLEASIERSYLFGWVVNPFSSISESLTHQFIVGSVGNGFGGTFIGNVSQNSVNEINAIFASSSATSTSALAGSCNVLSGFNVFNCIAFLFTPGGPYLDETMKSLKDGVLIRVPWGYVTRIYDIWDSSATTTLPAYVTTIQIGPGDTNTPATTSLSFNPGDMISGAGTLLDSIHDPIDNKTIRDVAGPVVKLVLALEVLFLIISDIIGSHKRNISNKENKQKKLS